MLLKRVWEVQERVQADCCSITTKKFRVMNIIKPCSLVENNWRFVSTCCFCLQCRSLLPWGWREQVTPKQGQIYTILHIVTVCSSIRQNLTSHQLPCLGKEVEMKPWIFLKRPSLSLSLSLGFLSPCAKRESFNRRHKFQRGSCGTAIYQRLHHETLLQNTPYSLVSPRF